MIDQTRVQYYEALLSDKTFILLFQEQKINANIKKNQCQYFTPREVLYLLEIKNFDIYYFYTYVRYNAKYGFFKKNQVSISI